ncbi:hypothetical protein L9F63_025774, partial [Diploptera punctata]
MDPDTKRAYELIQHSGTDFEKDAYPEPPSRKECRTHVTLRGPNSPLEMKLYSLTRVGATRTVNIEWNSVNSVLLDSEPQDPHDRLLVAAYVGQNSQGDRLTLRHTTLMPNIHGLASLIPLIFAPRIELRVNDKRTKLVGALCGLDGMNIQKIQYFQNMDMEVSFDTEITIEDLLEINRLRVLDEYALSADEGMEMPDTGPRDVIKCQKKIKEFLFS